MARISVLYLSHRFDTYGPRRVQRPTLSLDCSRRLEIDAIDTIYADVSHRTLSSNAIILSIIKYLRQNVLRSSSRITK